MKAKVFIVVDNLAAGGAQRQIIEYLKFANRSKFDIKIVNLDIERVVLEDEIKGLEYEIISIAHQGFFNLKTLMALVRLFKNEKPDIVHTYLFTADCYGRLAAKLSGVKIIISSVRCLDLWQKRHHILADRMLSAWTDIITINAQRIRTRLVEEEKIDADKILTIYNGIDLRRFKNLPSPDEVKKEFHIPQGAFVVGMAARFDLQKDYETFFLAAQKVLEQIGNVYFLAVGDGPLLSSQKEKTTSLKLGSRVIFTGLRKDVPSLINIMDVCVLSSHYEGCPNVILEYMASAKPVVAIDVGGCAELVVENKTGFVVPHKDYTALAGKIIYLLNDSNCRSAMGQEARKRIEDYFTAETMVKNTEDLYQKLLSEKVAFIFSQFPCYDETFILREMNALRDEGLNFTIFSLKTPKDAIIHPEAKELAQDTLYIPFLSLRVFLAQLSALLRHPIKYASAFFHMVRIHIKSSDFLLKSLALFPKSVYAAKMFKKMKISHIHAQWATHPATSAIIISRLSGIPFSFTGHAHDIYVNTAGLKEKIQDAQFVTTCTKDNKRHLLKLLNGRLKARDEGRGAKGEDKIIVNYHGVDLGRFRNKFYRPQSTVHSPLHILSVGSLLECKGFDTLIEACGLLKARGIDFQCTIAGGGRLQQSLQSTVHSLQLEKNVKFTGYITQDKLIPLYQEADVFVLAMLPEIHWGIPNVLLEAAACSVPIVCTLLPSIPELIEDGKTGFIIPAKDPKAIADVLERLYRDETARKQVGEAGRLVIEDRFDVVKNANRLKQLFVRG